MSPPRSEVLTRGPSLADSASMNLTVSFFPGLLVIRAPHDMNLNSPRVLSIG